VGGKGEGVVNANKLVVGDMTGRKSGTIINISSVSDRKTSPVAVGYTASKYAVRATSESLREAVGMQGVRVINVAPAYIKTNIHAGMGISFEEYCRLLGNPDFLSAEELAEIVLYSGSCRPRSVSGTSWWRRHVRVFELSSFDRSILFGFPMARRPALRRQSYLRRRKLRP